MQVCFMVVTYDIIIIVLILYIDGQKIAKKLCTQISRETKSLKSLLREYNACDYVSDTSLLNDSVTISEALEPSLIEVRLKGFGSWYNTVATGKKRQIIYAYLGLCRSTEEISILKQESRNLVVFYEMKRTSILEKLTTFSTCIVIPLAGVPLLCSTSC